MSQQPDQNSSDPAAAPEDQAHAVLSQGNSCAHCNKAASSPISSLSLESSSTSELKPCIACKSVSYCSRDCKKADMKKHKKFCASLAQEYFKSADVKMAKRAPPKADTHRGGLQKWQFDT